MLVESTWTNPCPTCGNRDIHECTLSEERLRRGFTVGTRRYFRRAPHDFRVVCAMCGTGGTTKHLSLLVAGDAAIRDSGHPCRACGAD